MTALLLMDYYPTIFTEKTFSDLSMENIEKILFLFKQWEFQSFNVRNSIN